MGVLESLQYVGETLDKPGAALRGLLAGRPDQLLNLLPFSDTVGITDPSQRVSGRDLLQEWGIADANQPGLDRWDVAGFLAEEVLDPVNWVPGGFLAKQGLKGASKLDEVASLGRAAGMVPSPRMTEELANDLMLGARGTEFAASELDPISHALRFKKYQDWLKGNAELDEFGRPLRLYHGTQAVFDDFDASRFGRGAGGNLVGPGVYLTDNPKVASGYTSNRSAFGSAPNVRMHHVIGPVAKANEPIGLEQLYDTAKSNLPDMQRFNFPKGDRRERLLAKMNAAHTARAKEGSILGIVNSLGHNIDFEDVADADYVRHLMGPDFDRLGLGQQYAELDGLYNQWNELEKLADATAPNEFDVLDAVRGNLAGGQDNAAFMGTSPAPALPGFTGVRHSGGNFFGKEKHNAYAMFDPNNVVPAMPSMPQMQTIAERFRDPATGALPFSVLAGMLGLGASQQMGEY